MSMSCVGVGLKCKLPRIQGSCQARVESPLPMDTQEPTLSISLHHCKPFRVAEGLEIGLFDPKRNFPYLAFNAFIAKLSVFDIRAHAIFESIALFEYSTRWNPSTPEDFGWHKRSQLPGAKSLERISMEIIKMYGDIGSPCRISLWGLEWLCGDPFKRMENVGVEMH
ncbi:hypothetical protein CRG98_002465 [Punica granatum]|uniref:Uncharacterized protein n=1 Tax=Punica granatum TaxID=22663 RepID=A0A2I0L8D0_PUNGR|nr:hypothetical protein CRG98_002465 [Punica granatum]